MNSSTNLNNNTENFLNRKISFFKSKSKLILLLFTLALACFWAFQGQDSLIFAKEQTWPEPPELEGQYYCLIDADTGEVLLEKNSSEQCYPASVTKLMTALLVVENLNLNDTITISPNAVASIKPGDANAALKSGEEIGVYDALNVMLIKSANDMAYALGEAVGGTIPNFANMMNEKAAALGCTNTHFSNASGLTDVYHYTTASDMAKICRAVINNPTIMEAISYTKNYTVAPTNKTNETRYYKIQHKMLSGRDYYYEYCIGGKTGYTDAAGNTLATFAEKDGLRLIMVIFRSEDNQRYIDTTAAFEYVYNNFRKVSLADIGDFGTIDASEMLGTLGASGAALGSSPNLSISLPENAYIILPNNANPSELTRIITYEDNGIKVYYNLKSHIVSTFDVDIVINSEDKKTSGLPLVSNIRKNIDISDFMLTDNYIAINLWLTIIVVSLILLAVIVFILSMISKAKKREIYSPKRKRRR